MFTIGAPGAPVERFTQQFSTISDCQRFSHIQADAIRKDHGKILLNRCEKIKG